jgi:uncharacterized repeat protein (TIGR04076 family)
MSKPKIKITLVDRLGKLCPMAMHVAFPYIDILRYGGTPPTSGNGEIRFCEKGSEEFITITQ